MEKFPVSTKNKNKQYYEVLKWKCYYLKETSLYLHDLLHTLKSLKHWNYITVIHNWIKRLNPVSPTSDQNQFSSNNIII